MRNIIFAIITMLALAAVGKDKTEIIPVKTWPKTITTADKVICNPTIAQCVDEGYRLVKDKPTTPAGRQIKSEKIIQDPEDANKCTYEIVYEDMCAPPPPAVKTNVSADRIRFVFMTNGILYGLEWMDAPASKMK